MSCGWEDDAAGAASRDAMSTGPLQSHPATWRPVTATSPFSVPWQHLREPPSYLTSAAPPGSPHELRAGYTVFQNKLRTTACRGETSVLKVRAEYAPGAGSLWSYRGRALLGGPGGGGGNTNPGLLS